MARRKTRRPKPKPKKKRRPVRPSRAAPPPDAATETTEALKGVRIPRSGFPGIVWPAVPGHRETMVLALQYQWEQTQWWPPETLLKHQLRQIELLLGHAARTNSISPIPRPERRRDSERPESHQIDFVVLAGDFANVARHRITG